MTVSAFHSDVAQNAVVIATNFVLTGLSSNLDACQHAYLRLLHAMHDLDEHGYLLWVAPMLADVAECPGECF